MIQFVTHCLRPLASAHEQALRRDMLVGTEEKQIFDIEYSFDDLLRTDILSRYSAYQTGISNGVLTINEARKKENLPEIDNGDNNYLPLQIGKVNEDGGIDAPTPVEAGFREGVQNWTEFRSEPETRDDKAERQKRELERRESIAGNFKEPLAEIIERSVKKSVRDIRKQIGLLKSPEQFFAWLRGYEEELSPYMVKSLVPLLTVMFKEVIDSASRELDKDKLGFGEAFEQWITGYAERYGTEFNERTYEQLFALVQDSGDATKAVESRLAEWEEEGHRAQKESAQESVNFTSAAAIAAYQAYNVTRITWRANANACPMCRQLDGKTVSIKESFVRKNDELKHGEEVITFSRNIRHAPLHGGCTCGVVANE